MADLVGVPEAELPVISDAYSLGPYLRVEILGTDPIKPSSKQKFKLNVLLGLKQKYMVDAEFIRDHFKSLGQDYHTTLDLALINGNGAPVLNQSVNLCFCDIPEVFSEDGYTHSDPNMLLQTVGHYKVLARVAYAPKLDRMSEGGEGVAVKGLEIIAGKNTLVIPALREPPALSKHHGGAGIVVPANHRIVIAGADYRAAVNSATAAARRK